MDPQLRQRAICHFSKHFFTVGKLYVDRNKARNELYKHLDRMRMSIVRMNLGSMDVERLRKRIDELMLLEKRYSRLFKTGNEEINSLNQRIGQLEHELEQERDEKNRLRAEYDEKIKSLSESLDSVKKHLRDMLIDKAKRHSKLISIERRIQKMD